MFINKALRGMVAVALVAAFSAQVHATRWTVEAQTILPNANNCVSVSSTSDGSSSEDNWSPRYRATNNCWEAIFVTWRHNYGLAHEGRIRCSSGSSTTIRSGGSYTLNAGVLPKGVNSRIRWCANYDRKAHQDLTGYKNCSASNQPTCPPLR